MNKEVVTELIQSELTTENLKKELHNILNGVQREAQFEAYFELEQKLGGKGASEKTASLIVDKLRN